MSVHDKAIQTLAGLGLTVLQAKVYLSLTKEEKATVKEIAKTSKIARQDLYRITPQLLSLGLIEKLVDTPTKFKAIPIKEAIDMLVERRQKESAQLEQESIEVLRFFARNKEPESKDEESQFKIINNLQACLMKAKKQVLSADKSINIVSKWDIFLAFTLEFIEEYTKALNNGVRVQIVTQRSGQIGSPPKKLLKLMKHPLFQIRYVSSLPLSIVAIFDKEEVNILLQSNKTPSESGFLTTNNLSLVELAQNYFEIAWDKGLEDVNTSNRSIQRELRVLPDSHINNDSC